MAKRLVMRSMLVAMAVLGTAGGMIAGRTDAQPAAKAPAAEAVKLPGGTWDYTALEKRFTVVSVKFDDLKNQVVWLLEAKVDLPNDPIFEATFYDADGVRLAGTPRTEFKPPYGYKTGDRVRATLTLPGQEVLDGSKKVVLTMLKTGEKGS